MGMDIITITTEITIILMQEEIHEATVQEVLITILEGVQLEHVIITETLTIEA